MSFRSISDALASRPASAAFLTTVLFAFFISIIQMPFSYISVTNSAEERVLRVAGSYRLNAENTAESGRFGYRLSYMEALLSQPEVSSVSLISPEGEIEKTVRKAHVQKNRQGFIHGIFESEPLEINLYGSSSLIVNFNGRHLESQFFDKVSTSFLYNTTLAALAAFFILIFFRKKFYEPIRRLTDSISNIRTDKLDEAYISVEQSSEIHGELARSVNSLIESLGSSISGMKDAEKQLIESREQYKSFYQNTTEGIFKANSRGDLISVNPAFLKIFSLSDEEHAKRRIKNIKRGIFAKADVRKKFAALLEKQGAVSSLEGTAYDAHDGVIHISIKAYSVCSSDGRVCYIEGMVEDVTEKSKVREQLVAKEAQEASMKAKNEFLSNLSHEVRTPLNSILGFAELLSTQGLNAKASSYLEAITDSGIMLLRMIDDMLDMSKIESGRLKIEKKPMNVKDSVLQAVNVLKSGAESKGLELKTEFHHSLPDYVLLDEVRFRQIVFSIASNAVKFTDSGYVKISSSANFDSSSNTYRLDVFIEDTGSGINPEEISSIFNSFTKASAQQDYVPGAGLGLSVASEMAELMGGRITAESTPGTGSVFTVSFENLKAPDIGTGSVGEVDYRSIQFEPHKVLIVDDSDYNRLLLRNYLSRMNFEINEADNGRTAIEAARRETPDIILMDIKMPIMDGYEAAIFIKKDDTLQDIPLVAVSAGASDEDIRSAEEAGFDDYLKKPISRKNLYGILMKYAAYGIKENDQAGGAKVDKQ